MGNFLQTGHQSWGYINAEGLDTFDGVVLSPVNDKPGDVKHRVAALRKSNPSVEVIFDPQIYNPLGKKGKLTEWNYYSDDIGTIDHSNLSWWIKKSQAIAADAASVHATTMCVPAYIPRVLDTEYYKSIVELGDEVNALAQSNGLDTALTVIVPLSQFHSIEKTFEIASVVSSSSCERIYLNFLDEKTLGRQPLHDQSALASAIHLVRLLSSNQRVHVGCVGQELMLWLASGATDLSTGNYINLRRFTPSRWEEEDESAKRNNSYWCDDRLLTLLRDADVLRLDRAGWYGADAFHGNEFSEKIISILRGGSGDAWQKLSWLQYMKWFSNVTARVKSANDAEKILLDSLDAWKFVEQQRILFFDSYNRDLVHPISWLNALNEGFSRRA